jgi:hypothetical protein
MVICAGVKEVEDRFSIEYLRRGVGLIWLMGFEFFGRW